MKKLGFHEGFLALYRKKCFKYLIRWLWIIMNSATSECDTLFVLTQTNKKKRWMLYLVVLYVECECMFYHTVQATFFSSLPGRHTEKLKVSSGNLTGNHHLMTQQLLMTSLNMVWKGKGAFGFCSFQVAILSRILTSYSFDKSKACLALYFNVLI